MVEKPAALSRAYLNRAGVASLDVLRFLAAAFILLYHFGESAPVHLERLFPVFAQGWLATDFFLILSGFILSRAYGLRLAQGRVTATQFMIRRVGRIWPSHVVVLLIFGAMMSTALWIGVVPQHMENYRALDFVAELFLVQGWGFLKAPGWNIPTWTLSALVLCYALFSIYGRFSRRLKPLSLIGLIIVITVIANTFAFKIIGHAFADLPFHFGLLRAIPLFVIGTLIEPLCTGLRLGRGQFITAMIAIVLAIIMLESLPRTVLTDTLVLSLLAMSIVMAGSVRFSENSVTHRLGRASFALFLTHSLVGAVWFSLLSRLNENVDLPAFMTWSLWGLGVGLALGMGFLFDALIDRPLSQWVQVKMSGADQ